MADEPNYWKWFAIGGLTLVGLMIAALAGDTQAVHKAIEFAKKHGIDPKTLGLG